MTKTSLGSLEIDTCCITGASPNRGRPRLLGGLRRNRLNLSNSAGRLKGLPGEIEDDEGFPPGGAFPILAAGREGEMTLRRHKIPCQCN